MKDQPLYKTLSDEIRSAILDGHLSPGDKLPSKRAMAAEKKLSIITVAGAYDLLVDEGFIESTERRGYFVSKSAVSRPTAPPPAAKKQAKPEPRPKFDFRSASAAAEGFPFYTWAKLVRETISEKDTRLLSAIDPKGVPELREEISRRLSLSRGIICSPEQIIIGAGSEYLIGLVYQLLGKGKCAVEDPGFTKAAKIYACLGAAPTFIPTDSEGIRADLITAAPDINIVHVTPSHSFPLGTVMSMSRRSELISWRRSVPGRYIVDDDFDSEFRYEGRCPSSLFALDSDGVIYMNTFTRTLAPSMRIGYIVLPPSLAERYEKHFSFYSSTVPAIEQYVLARFMKDGSLERHINRMRRIYRRRRDALIESISKLGDDVEILGKEAGVHLLVRLPERLPETEVIKKAASLGVSLAGVSEYRRDGSPSDPLYTNALVMNFAGRGEDDIRKAVSLLAEAL